MPSEIEKIRVVVRALILFKDFVVFGPTLSEKSTFLSHTWRKLWVFYLQWWQVRFELMENFCFVQWGSEIRPLRNPDFLKVGFHMARFSNGRAITIVPAI